MKKYKICVLPGDGIGPDVTREAVKVLKATTLYFEFNYGDIGYNAYLEKGSALPQETIEKISKADATLFGAVTTPPEIENYSSPIVQLRKHFDLYANIRPCKSYPIVSQSQNVDMVIVRENTEDLYSGIERVEEHGNKVIAERIITRKGSERIIKYAFELALKRKYKKVTVVHKANILRKTCGLFRKVAFEVAKEYPKIEMQEMLVDACAMQLIKDPSQFQVIVTTNMFGDILSDEASMLVGGLGVACSGNIGNKTAIFEPVHGSAPKYAGLNKSNPVAAIMSAAMMLDHLDEEKEAQKIRDAVIKTIQDGVMTYDLNGKNSTSEVGDAVAANVKAM